jgi:hypothetical protein
MPHTNRRTFFGSVANGLQGAALASLFNQDLYGGNGLHAAETPHQPARRAFDLAPKQTHFKPRAKAVIQLFMQGGPSQVDLFDPKPELDRNHGKSILKDIAKDLSSPDSAGGLMDSPGLMFLSCCRTCRGMLMTSPSFDRCSTHIRITNRHCSRFNPAN